VLEGLREFLTSTQQWSSKNTKMEDYLEYLYKKMKLKDPFYLGLRMTSIALSIGVGAFTPCGNILVFSDFSINIFHCRF
jgi:hypothetical protein